MLALSQYFLKLYLFSYIAQNDKLRILVLHKIILCMLWDQIVVMLISIIQCFSLESLSDLNLPFKFNLHSVSMQSNNSSETTLRYFAVIYRQLFYQNSNHISAVFQEYTFPRCKISPLNSIEFGNSKICDDASENKRNIFLTLAVLIPTTVAWTDLRLSAAP
jgi:hypothetical protein